MLIISACSSGREPPEESGYAALNRQMAEEQRHLQEARIQQEQQLEHSPSPRDRHEEVGPLIPEFDPLQESIVSISVNNKPLHDILFVVARNAGLNLVVSPEVSLDKRITISFDKTPASIVVDRLLDSYDLYWSVEDNVLAVRPFEEKVFKLDFLDSNTRVAIDSGGNIFGERSGDRRTGTDDLYVGSHNLKGNFAMQSTFGGEDDGNSIYGFLQKNLNDILMDATGERQGHFVLDPTAGSLYVRASPSKMRVANNFIKQLKSKLSQQVVIDAQILEVSLSDSFQLGVDWSYISQELASNFAYSVNLGWQSAQGFGTYGLESEDPVPIVIDSRTGDVDEVYRQFSATIQALETFGQVSVVSNPHVRSRHLQPALVTSGTTRNFIQEITRSRRATDEDWVDYSVNTGTAFEGVMLGVVPFITDNGDVDLDIFPITSQVDLSETAKIGGDQITLPKVNVRNVNTKVRVNDGDTVILGGLIQKGSRERERATPGASRIPGLGWLFKQREDSQDLSELVVIMHVRVVSQ
ncbi:hypothetical protein [Desulfonatronospira thiodismutans]|nr:hypothetical protein [Desulfonatronospira thiodismutans]